MKMLTLTETKLLFREPLALFWGLAFPMVLLAVMGLSATNVGGVPLVTVYEPIVIAFISATTPAGPVRVIGAQLIVSRPGSPWWPSCPPPRWSRLAC